MRGFEVIPQTKITNNQGFQAFNILSEQKNEQLSEQAPRTA